MKNVISKICQIYFVSLRRVLEHYKAQVFIDGVRNMEIPTNAKRKIENLVRSPVQY